MKNLARLSNAILRNLIRQKYPGKYRLYKTLMDMGLLQFGVTLPLYGDSIVVPAYEWSFWGLSGVEGYQVRRLDVLARFVNERMDSVHLVDLGADIGVVSRKLIERCPKVVSVAAVEPNPKSFFFLKQNLAGCGIPAACHNVAVSDHSGRAALVSDPAFQSDHSGYVDLSMTGETVLQPLDQIFPGTSDDLLLKIDVEGQEPAVFRGGTNTLRAARRVAIFVEIHRGVLDRQGTSPESIFVEAEKIRDVKWFLSEPDLPAVDRTRPFFQQFPDIYQHDLIGWMDGDQ